MASQHHNHTKSTNSISSKNAFIIGIILNLIFVLIEAIVGVKTHSSALLSDAGHNLSDVASLALALGALQLNKVKSSVKYTYGFQKSTILVALLNAIILLIVIGAIILETTLRINKPEAIQGKTVALVAFIGIIINSLTALLFIRDKNNDLNIKGAFSHLMADAGVSFGVVIGGIIIHYTNYFWVDFILSYVIAIIIFISTWKLFRETLRLSLDGVPHSINFTKVKSEIETMNGIYSICHLHIWGLSTTQNALTARIIIESTFTNEQEINLKNEIKVKLIDQNIHHITLEIERQDHIS
jgi:cobalt-zinc-cadmium efflux system protein